MKKKTLLCFDFEYNNHRAMEEILSKVRLNCQYCDHESVNIDQYFKHINLHCSEPKFRVQCLYCPRKFKNLTYYKEHHETCLNSFSEEKNELEKIEETGHSNVFWHCTNCPEKFKLSEGNSQGDFKKVKAHCLQHARNKETVLCPIAQCTKFYNVNQSLNRHLLEHSQKGQFALKVENLISDSEPVINQNQPELVSDNESNSQNTPQANASFDESLTVADSDHEDQENATDQPDLPSNYDIIEMNNLIEKSEANYALKLSSKDLLSRQLVNEVFAQCANLHAMKLEFIENQLRRTFLGQNSVQIEDVINTIHLVDNNAGLGNELSTHKRRENVLREHFDFIIPEKHVIKIVGNVTHFYYSLPIVKTLGHSIYIRTVIF